MRNDAHGKRIAYVQNLGFCAFRTSREDRGTRAVRRRRAHCRGTYRCRSRRRGDQAANRARGRWPLWRVPHDRAASPRRTCVLRVRIRQERTGQPAPGRVGDLSAAGRRISEAGPSSFAAMLATGTIIEVTCDDQAVQERSAGGRPRGGDGHGRSGRDVEANDEGLRRDVPDAG